MTGDSHTDDHSDKGSVAVGRGTGGLGGRGTWTGTGGQGAWRTWGEGDHTGAGGEGDPDGDRCSGGGGPE